MITYIEFNVGALWIRRIDHERVPTDNQNYIYARFNFSPEWDSIEKTALFNNIIVPIVDDVCHIPNQLFIHPGEIIVSVYGGKRRTVDTAKIFVIQSGFTSGELPTEPEEGAVWVQSPDGTVPYVRSSADGFEFYADNQWNQIESVSGTLPDNLAYLERIEGEEFVIAPPFSPDGDTGLPSPPSPQPRNIMGDMELLHPELGYSAMPRDKDGTAVSYITMAQTVAMPDGRSLAVFNAHLEADKFDNPTNINTVVVGTVYGLEKQSDGSTVLKEPAAAASATWGGITGTLSNQTDLNTALNGKAATNHANAATTYGRASASLYGHALASSVTPKAHGTAAIGTDNGTYSRGDHVHPLQTTAATLPLDTSTTGIATTAFVVAQIASELAKIPVDTSLQARLEGN